MADRCARVHAARNWLKAHNIRCSQIKRNRSQTFEGLTASQLRTAQVQSMSDVRAEDHRAGASEASCLSRPSGSCDGRSSFSPDGRTSCSNTTPQTSGQKSQSSKGFEIEPAEATMFRALSARELLEPGSAGYQLCRKGTVSEVRCPEQELIPQTEAPSAVLMWPTSTSV